MPYELRVAGKPRDTFETEQEAMAAARELVQADADANVEVFDLATGQPAAPGASRAEREEFATKVGF